MRFCSKLIVALFVKPITNVVPFPIEDNFHQSNCQRNDMNQGSKEGNDPTLMYCDLLRLREVFSEQASKDGGNNS